MRRTSAKGTGGVTTAVVRRKSRGGKKPAKVISGRAGVPVGGQVQEEEVTSEEMTPVALETTSTEDVEDQAETTSEGDEWPG